MNNTPTHLIQNDNIYLTYCGKTLAYDNNEDDVIADPEHGHTFTYGGEMATWDTAKITGPACGNCTKAYHA